MVAEPVLWLKVFISGGFPVAVRPGNLLYLALRSPVLAGSAAGQETDTRLFRCGYGNYEPVELRLM